ncbi:enoyl-CoA hydratase/isomerase family protein [Vibrio aestuarianus]|uniref:Enoyl-CoA hydratase-related protein n=1 Tax=Vibrio aestuarianus TaxID=28171 RepID=A0ABD7YME0_9VIBR|nr:enoyl-CoA hydratase-related protein [Vibrio aestuarianus]MDE1231965.1 enoyl-CoA hydratase-related protein [Vibrio aestuarianus]MDE1328750.1 enoyl-CoA hydratase-related protein [Vibrio aestuarianus]WGK85796.1 enoyl-CoA hydratase-related protein [Vibrio aestuarianus]CAH8204882.1 Enoyl-CoA hydratase [Vibrio aestuarianus]
MTTSYETINTFEKDNIFYLEVSRPDELNALSQTVLEEMLDAVNNIDVTKYIGVILTGSGDKSFIAGADITGMSKMTPEETEAFAKLGQDVTVAMEDLALPMIACVHGFALGGGCEMAMSCDFIYASKQAVFGQPEVKWGVLPAFGGTQRLPKYIGRNRAKELIYSGTFIDVDKAYEWGLVNKITDDKASCLQAAVDCLKVIGRNGPLAVASAKEVMNAGNDMSNKDGLKQEGKVFGIVARSNDKAEGTKAFVEKRHPVFTRS